jgi:NAD(P)-dependent dehydrogenase (short-subunit alcohol dehydrogenase family)
MTTSSVSSSGFPSPFDLTGHVSLITGGNSGIGLGMAEALVAHGATVAIWGTNPKKNVVAQQRLAEIAGSPDRVADMVCDVGDEDAVEAAMAQVLERCGRIDSCFVNAGVGGQAPSFLQMTSEEWRRVMRVNLDGAFFTARAATRHMVDRAESGDTAGGSLIFTTSGSAFFGQQKGQHYGASKGGVISMMRAIAVEHARHGVRSNAVLPGWIESEMTAGALGWQKFVDKVLPRVPTRRWGVPADFGGLAVYLASSASSYHTGDVITIDGGYHSF